MSAYMPVRNSWSLEAHAAGRAVRRTAVTLAAGALLVLAVGTLARLGLPVARSGDLMLLPSGVSGSLLVQSVTAKRDHGYFVVQGEAVNEGSRPASRVEAVVELFDERGGLRSVESALVEMPSIGPHDESPFVVHLADPGDVTSFRVRFRSIGSAAAR